VLPEYQYAGRVAVTVDASPASVMHALRHVTLAEMPWARAIGKLRYLPARLMGRFSAQESDDQRSFFDIAARLILAERPDEEVIIGCAGKLHNLVDQQMVDFNDAAQFHGYRDPNSEKHVESFRILPWGPGRSRLVAEHRTQVLGPPAAWKFALYWHLMVGWSSNILLRWYLLAAKRRAEASRRN